jgi:hypothetical protein
MDAKPRRAHVGRVDDRRPTPKQERYVLEPKAPKENPAVFRAFGRDRHREDGDKGRTPGGVGPVDRPHWWISGSEDDLLD